MKPEIEVSMLLEILRESAEPDRPDPRGVAEGSDGTDGNTHNRVRSERLITLGSPAHAHLEDSIPRSTGNEPA